MDLRLTSNGEIDILRDENRHQWCNTSPPATSSSAPTRIYFVRETTTGVSLLSHNARRRNKGGSKPSSYDAEEAGS